MALRHHAISNINPNQENLSSKTTGKQLNALKPQLIPKRAALGEVGNKLSNQNVRDNANSKKDVLGQHKTANGMGPPKQALPRKKTLSQQSKKENETNRTDSADTNSKMVRQESILLKNVQEIKSYSSKQIELIDPDSSTRNNPQMVTEYVSDIFEYLRDLEQQFPIVEKHLENHKSTPKMRTILVNWLVEVHENFKLCIETLHLCVAIVDRYLQVNKNIDRDTLQLAGTSALLIACKYEEMYLPDLNDFVYICDDTFSRRQILLMEIDILKRLEFNLGRPLSIHFLRRYGKVGQVRNEHHVLGKYFLELMLMEYSMCHVQPSIQAAAACCLALAVLNEVSEPSKVWTLELAHYSTYTYSDFKPLVVELAQIVVKTETSKYDTVQKKYSAPKYCRISLNSKLKGAAIMKLTNPPKK